MAILSLAVTSEKITDLGDTTHAFDRTVRLSTVGPIDHTAEIRSLHGGQRGKS